MALKSVFYGEMGEEFYELRDNGKNNYSLVKEARREKYESVTLKWIRDLSRHFTKDIIYHIFMRANGLVNRCLT